MLKDKKMKLDLDVKGLTNKFKALAKKEENENNELKNLNIPYHFRLLKYGSIVLYVLALVVFFLSGGSAFELMLMMTCILGGIILTGSYAIITALYLLNQPKTDCECEEKEKTNDDKVESTEDQNSIGAAV